MIELFDVDNYCLGLPVITSSNLFLDEKREKYDPNGLFSENIFDLNGTKNYYKNEAYIDLKTKIINPVIFRLLKRIDRKCYDILIQNKTFTINNESFVEESGELMGVSDFIDNYHRINFKGGTKTREKFVQFLKDKNNLNKLFISKILVIPPGFRPIYVNDIKEGLMYDELNDFYIKILNKINDINVTDKLFLKVYTNSIQILINEFYEYIKTKVSTKKGYLRGELLGKRVDFSGRGVITGNPNLKPYEFGIPFQMCVNLFKPFIIFNMKKKKPDFWDKEMSQKYGYDYNVDIITYILDEISNGYKINEKMYHFTWDIVKETIKNRYVIVKRDPAIHRESLQGMKPVLVEGYSLQMNPASVGKFNADFDGDQMAVYHPLSIESQYEIKTKMITEHGSSGFNDFSKELTNDFVMGLYVLTIDQ